jgi:hypothetical protein
VDQRSHRRLAVGKAVVPLDRLRRGQDLDRHTIALELAHGLRADLQHAEDAPREHDRRRPVLDQLGDVRRLVPGRCRVPVSRQSQARAPPG